MDGVNFDTLRYYVIFMRYKRSGSALLANLLDAHPNAIFVRNEELYGKFERWEDPKLIYTHLYNNAKAYRNKPFSANGYRYPIEGVGHVEKPLVIGHKSSTRRYLPVANSQKKLNEFQKAVDLPLKFLHLVRSPYDQVNARWQQKEFRRIGAPVDELISHVREQTAGNAKMRAKAEDYHQVHYEDLQAHPVSTMATVCDFLGLPVRSKHLANCKELVYQGAEEKATTWTDDTRAQVKHLIEDYPEFYRRYA
jgi:hypothetical protein